MLQDNNISSDLFGYGIIDGTDGIHKIKAVIALFIKITKVTMNG